MNSVNKIPLRSQNTYLTAGDDSVHVSSVITATLRSENVWGYAFGDNKRYLLLLSMRFGAMTTRFFLPTNRRLILELPTQYTCKQLTFWTTVPVVLGWLDCYCHILDSRNTHALAVPVSCTYTSHRRSSHAQTNRPRAHVCMVFFSVLVHRKRF